MLSLNIVQGHFGIMQISFAFISARLVLFKTYFKFYFFLTYRVCFLGNSTYIRCAQIKYLNFLTCFLLPLHQLSSMIFRKVSENNSSSVAESATSDYVS